MSENEELSISEEESKDITIRPEGQPVDPFTAMIERVAANPDLNPENLEKMLDMQERIMDRQASVAYAEAMAACQAEMPTVGKNRSGDGNKYTYADLAKINRLAKPIWEKHGFSLEFGQEETLREGMIRIGCDIQHVQGHTKHRWVEVSDKNKSTTGKDIMSRNQEAGSGFTYGRRYLTGLIFNIVIDDDDNDGADIEYISEEQIQQINLEFEKIPGRQADRLMRWLEERGYPTLADVRADDFEFCIAQIRTAVDDYLAKQA